LILPFALVAGEDDGDNEVTETHAEATDGESRLSSDTVNVEDRWDCGNKLVQGK